MPYRKIPLAENYYYHLYNRGNNRQNIFLEERNYNFLLKRFEQNIHDAFEIVAYCLMPNHYHFIIKILDQDSFIKAIKKIFISYSKAINTNYGRSGHLFEGRYKYKIIPENNYLLHLSRYIHLNPVRAQLANKPEDWIHSSYSEYLGKRKLGFIKPEIILTQISNYRNFVESYSEEQAYYVKGLLF